MKKLFMLALLPLALCAMVYNKAVKESFLVLVLVPTLAWAAPTLLSLIVALPLSMINSPATRPVLFWGTTIGAAGPFVVYISIIIGFFVELVYSLLHRRN